MGVCPGKHARRQRIRMDRKTNSFPYQADVVFLNGPSSSGKSTLARTLQSLLDYPFVRLDIDDFLEMFPERYQGLGDRAQLGILQTDDPQGPGVSLGRFGEMFVAGFHHALAAFARQGNKLIVVHLLLDRSWLVQCIELLSEYRILFVGVNCEPGTLDQRELQRCNRSQGFARRHNEVVHSFMSYDMFIDTTRPSPLECAEMVRDKMMEPRSESAVQWRLRARGGVT
jgi:chloramphenicol 3-O phosphotransferase